MHIVSWTIFIFSWFRQFEIVLDTRHSTNFARKVPQSIQGLPMLQRLFRSLYWPWVIVELCCWIVKSYRYKEWGDASCHSLNNVINNGLINVVWHRVEHHDLAMSHVSRNHQPKCCLMLTGPHMKSTSTYSL